MERNAFTVANDARDTVIKMLDAGADRPAILHKLIALGIPGPTADNFVDQIEASWKKKRVAAELRASGRRHVWIGAIGLGAGLSLVAGIGKAMWRRGMTNVPERLEILPWLVVAISACVVLRGFSRYVGAVRVMKKPD